jgi:hypothetical protein
MLAMRRHESMSAHFTCLILRLVLYPHYVIPTIPRFSGHAILPTPRSANGNHPSGIMTLLYTLSKHMMDISAPRHSQTIEL